MDTYSNNFEIYVLIPDYYNEDSLINLSNGVLLSNYEILESGKVIDEYEDVVHKVLNNLFDDFHLDILMSDDSDISLMIKIEEDFYTLVDDCWKVVHPIQ